MSAVDPARRPRARGSRVAAPPGLARAAGAVATVMLLALVVLAVPGAHSAPAAHPARWTGVMAIDVTSYVTEHATFTVAVHVADAAAVSLAYFTFCQLTSSVCYQAVALTPNGTGWLAGTTNPMSAYPGMKVGVHAGFNVTIEYANYTNVTEPTVPNVFTGLNVTPSVTNDYYFEITVSPQVFELGGVVQDKATGAAVVGATVVLSPGDDQTTTSSSGAYAFAGLVNGSYTLNITKTGYPSSSQTVQIAGQNATQNVLLSNVTGTPGGGHPSTSSTPNFFGTPTGLAVVGVIVLAALVVGGLTLTRMRKGKGGIGAATSESVGSDATPKP